MIPFRTKKTFAHGVHPPENKNDTSRMPIRQFPFAPVMIVPLSQHIGKPARSLVQEGQEVMRGQKIAEADGFVSVAMHAPASGIIKRIGLAPSASGKMIESIYIAPFPSSSQEINEGQPCNIDTATPDEIITAIQQAGIVGLGGAAFPTHVKLKIPDDKWVDTLIINGEECEPYLTTDHRVMLEQQQDLFTGIRYILKATGAKRAIIGVENNKIDAAESLRANLPVGEPLSVEVVPAKYPQGAEKMLITALTGREGVALSEPVYPPRDGHWVVCGYGRFGKAVCARLAGEGIRVVVIEARPELTGQPESDFVAGRGTEAETLNQADIENAAGLVAGTDNDANNLSIVMTARQLNPELFFVVRQNQHDDHDIIAAVDADMVMHPSSIIADKIRVLLATPMLYEFMSLALYQEDAWACELASRVSALVQDEVPSIREWSLDAGHTAAMHEYLVHGGQYTVEDLLRDPWYRARSLQAIVLLIHRRNDRILLPEVRTALKPGDRLLICGSRGAFTRMEWTVSHRHTLEYVKTGVDRPQGWLWRRLATHKGYRR